MFKSSDVPYNPCLLSLVAKSSPGKLYIVAWCPYDGLGPEVLTKQNVYDSSVPVTFCLYIGDPTIPLDGKALSKTSYK